jgi:hypothetical protein
VRILDARSFARRLGANDAAIGVIACGAIAPELREILEGAAPRTVVFDALPAHLHNHPERIAAAVRGRVTALRERGIVDIVVGYADCGTAGGLDAVCAELGVQRLAGAHCYELFAGTSEFAHLHVTTPGTFYLTDFLARHFRRLVVTGLGLDAHPELAPQYFGNYSRVVYLRQTIDGALLAAAEDAAAFLALPLVVVDTGLGPLARAWQNASQPPVRSVA